VKGRRGREPKRKKLAKRARDRGPSDCDREEGPGCQSTDQKGPREIAVKKQEKLPSQRSLENRPRGPPERLGWANTLWKNVIGKREEEKTYAKKRGSPMNLRGPADIVQPVMSHHSTAK